jgi:hypothetical protein
VRHVRMLGLCMVALLVLSAVASSSAMAKKSGYSAETWEQYKSCPYTNTKVEICFAGITSGGKEGGFFKLGRVNVPLNKPITLQGGAYSCEDEEPVAEACEELPYYGDYVVPATNGGQTLESPELKVEKGLKLVTPQVEEIAEWPQALKESFKEAKKNKELNLNVKIEVAGNSLFENPAALSAEALLLEHYPAFELPLKVRMINPWLEKLGGGPCTVGNDAHPVMQYLTSEGVGSAGSFTAGDNFTNVALADSTLVDLGWQVEASAEASGCGGSYEGYVDSAINHVLELPGRQGVTILSGSLYTSNRTAARAQFELGNWERYNEVE